MDERDELEEQHDAAERDEWTDDDGLGSEGERRYEGLDLDDPERLPWLETADDYDDGGVSTGRMIGLVLAGLLLIGAIAGGIYWLQTKDTGDGDGDLIAAEEGDYKEKPDDPGGKDIEGEGDAALAASEGKKVESKLGSDERTSGSTKAGAEAEKADSAGSVKKESSGSSTGGVNVQIASLGDEASANSEWSNLSRRFEFLSDYDKRIVTAKVEGRTVYRLNAVAADADKAQALCAKLKAAGGSCIVGS